MSRRCLLILVCVICLSVARNSSVEAGGHFYPAGVVYSTPLLPVASGYAPIYYAQPSYFSAVGYRTTVIQPAVIQPTLIQPTVTNVAYNAVEPFAPAPVAYATPVNYSTTVISSPVVQTVSYAPAVVPYHVPVAYVTPVTYVAGRNYTYRARTGWFGATRVIERVR